MARKSKRALNKARGKRHKEFRTEVLDKTQQELATDLGKGQATIVNLDKGQDIPADCKAYYTEQGLNWNWYYTGQGTRETRPEGFTNDTDVSYTALSSLISPNAKIQVNEALENFMRTMEEQLKNYNYVVRATHFSVEERNDLYERFCERIIKETEALKKNF